MAKNKGKKKLIKIKVMAPKDEVKSFCKLCKSEQIFKRKEFKYPDGGPYYAYVCDKCGQEVFVGQKVVGIERKFCNRCWKMTGWIRYEKHYLTGGQILVFSRCLGCATSDIVAQNIQLAKT